MIRPSTTSFSRPGSSPFRPSQFPAWFLPVLILGLSGPGCQKAENQPPANIAFAAPEATPTPAPAVVPPEGRQVPVVRGRLRQIFPAVGSLRAKQVTNIGPQVTGRVDAVLVDVGDVVREGQELVRIDPSFFSIELDQRKAEVESAKVALANAELNYNRMKALWEVPTGESPSISQKLYDDAKAQYNAAQAQLKVAEAALRYSEKRVRETVIRAPYDGMITKRFVHLGELVTSVPVSRILEIQEIRTLELEFSLPQTMLSQVQKGTPIEFTVEGVAEESAPGSIAIVYPDMDEITRSFRCRVYVDNTGLKYRPGLLAQVRVILQEIPDALIVPRTALNQKGDDWRVTVLKDNVPEVRPVKVGLLTDDQAEIVEGLAEHEVILIPKTAS
ncbi:MAG: efflux RND transporter periplasmic adaptor subunit [bacterium]